MFALFERLDGGETVGMVAIVAGALVLALGIVVIGWASVSANGRQAALKLEMVQRGMSVQEIEQLTLSEPARMTRIQFEQRVREAQVAADLKRDLLARGVPPESFHFVASASPEADAQALAEAICAMVQDGVLEPLPVAALIRAFLQRSAPPADAGARKGLVSSVN